MLSVAQTLTKNIIENTKKLICIEGDELCKEIQISIKVIGFLNIIKKPDTGGIKSEYKTPEFIDDDKNYVIKINEILEKLVNDFRLLKIIHYLQRLYVNIRNL